MNDYIHAGDRVFQWVLQTTWQAAVLAGLIFLAQWLLRKRLSPSWRSAVFDAGGELKGMTKVRKI